VSAPAPPQAISSPLACIGPIFFITLPVYAAVTMQQLGEAGLLANPVLAGLHRLMALHVLRANRQCCQFMRN
jgi:hypothetical protein